MLAEDTSYKVTASERSLKLETSRIRLQKPESSNSMNYGTIRNINVVRCYAYIHAVQSFS